MIKKTRKAYFKELYPFMKKNRKLYFYLSGLKILLMVLSLLPQIFYLILIDNVILEREINLLWIVVAGYIGIYIIQTFTMTINKLFYNKLFYNYTLSVKTKMLRIFLKMDPKEYKKYNVGEMKSCIDEDVRVTEQFFNVHILDYIYAIISMIVISIILCFINPLLALVGFTMVPVSFWFTSFVGKKVNQLNEEQRKIKGSFNSFLFACFSSWKEIKSNNLDKKQIDKFNLYKEKMNPLFTKNEIYCYINRTFVAFKDFFITRMNLYFIGGLLIIQGYMEVGILLVFMNYYELFFKNIAQVTDSNLGFNKAIPNLERVVQVLKLKIKNKPKVKITTSNIKVENVSYKYYDKQEMVLDNISFHVNAREHIAIVGKSGCGKTTLANIIMGLYTPLEGKVKVGEFDIHHISFESISKKIGIVAQESLLFNLTIRENLEMVRKNVTYQECVNVTKQANIYDFIYSLPDKFDTVIGERGVKLSGGQRQRMCIARMILKNPDIIIFDESTSALDSENESAMVSFINQLSENKTVISIAHRLSTIICCDRVIVLDKGRIVGIGEHNQLRGNNEAYDLLFGNQYIV